MSGVYHRWVVGISQSPNDEYFPLDTKWRWSFKLNGSYNLPHDVLVGAIIDVANGPSGSGLTSSAQPTRAEGQRSDSCPP